MLAAVVEKNQKGQREHDAMKFTLDGKNKEITNDKLSSHKEVSYPLHMKLTKS